MRDRSTAASKEHQALTPNRAALVRLLLAEESRRKDQIPRINREREVNEPLWLPVSWSQQRLWFIDQLEGAGAAYQSPIALRMRGPLHTHLLQLALDRLIERHEVLRTNFANRNGSPWQLTVASRSFPLSHFDLSMSDPAEKEILVGSHQRQEVETRFHLETGPLIRGRLLRLSSEKHVLLITLHHIISDGWSAMVMLGDIAELYNAATDERDDSLETLPIQYADYSVWQREYYKPERLEQKLRFWRDCLDGAPPQLDLPTDHQRPAVPTYRGANVQISLRSDLVRDLKALARKHEVTLFMALYAAWALLLSRLSGQDDVVIGTPVANRERPELSNLIGFFANTVALRSRIDPTMSLLEYLRSVKRITLEAFENQEVPFEQVVESVQPQRSLSRNPIFQAMIVLLNVPQPQLDFKGLTVSLEDEVDEPAMFDVLLSLEERDGEVFGLINYATELFDRRTMLRWSQSLQTLLEGMVRGSHLRISDLPILARQEQQLLRAFNSTGATYPAQGLVHDLVECQVARTPDAIAVTFGRDQLTYGELNSQADDLANYLRLRGVGPDRPVGVCLERGLDMIVGILAILKAGGAYLPLDPSYPCERLALMVRESQPSLILAAPHLFARLPKGISDFVTISPEVEFGNAEGDRCNLDEHAASPENLVYVIYTSGSTGAPKATAMPHSAMVNLLEWHRRSLPLSHSGTRVLQFASLSFDVAFQEIFSTLSEGGTLVLLDEWTRRDISEFAKALRDQDVERIFLPPLMLESLAQYSLTANLIPIQLREIITAGEQLRVTPEIARMAQQLKTCTLHNHYGPTETHVVTTFSMTGAPATWPTLPVIGAPISNVQIHILDRAFHQLPIGVRGEIYVGGDCLARGYLNRADLTSERFVSVILPESGQQRLYRTGDIGRWRADGQLEFLGRNDHQVKIRGFRVEVGEIEAALLADDRVREAAVVAQQDGAGKRLVGYLVVDEATGVSTEQIRRRLSSALPEHMIPSCLVTISVLPRSPNGKIDRSALSTLDPGIVIGDEFEAPIGEMEQSLARIWQEILRTESPISRTSHFFQLGGHSLLIMQMMERLRRIGLRINVREVFLNPVCAEMARALARVPHSGTDIPPNLIPPGCAKITSEMLPFVALTPLHIEQIEQAIGGGATNIQDIYPLAPLQEGLLFHHLVDERRGDTYVMPILFSLASRDKLEDLVRALQALVDRHDVLRTAILWEGLPSPVQVVLRRVQLSVKYVDLEGHQDARSQLRELMAPSRQHLNLNAAPLMSLQVAPDSDGVRWYALLQLHHLVCDNESLGVMLSELSALYTGQGARLPYPKPYRDHVAQTVRRAEINDAAEFFRQMLSDVYEPTAPYGLHNVHGDGTRIAQASRNLSLSLGTRVRAQARELGVSSATIFHAAWAVVLSRICAREDVVFGTVLLGRMYGRAANEHALGMFINTLPIRLHTANRSVPQLIDHTQRQLGGLLDHEHASLAMAQRCASVSTGKPLFTTLLNYRHSTSDPVEVMAATSDLRVLESHSWTNYPIMLSVDDMESDFRLYMDTDRQIAPDRILGYVETTLDSIVSALESGSTATSAELAVLPQEEWRTVVSKFNLTSAPQRPDICVHELFEHQAKRTPNETAALYGESCITYAQLDNRADNVAERLRSQGVKAGDLVAICVERSLDMLAGVVGILKAGAAYVPLDPNYPTDRLRFMLEDSNPAVILIQESVRGVLPNTQAVILNLEASQPATSGWTRSEPERPASDSLAYVIYTSGSTGRPKGTAMAHRAMVNLIEYHRDTFGSSAGKRVLQFAALSFDVAFQEVFSTLCTGGTLVLLEEWVRRDARALTELLCSSRIQRLFITPLMLQTLAEYCRATDTVLGDLRDVITAGEQLRVSPEIRDLYRRLPRCRLHNHYGPTETHVVTAHLLSADVEQWSTHVPIGRPIANVAVYVLNGALQPLPVGVPGEIYIGGVCLARGYWGHPELTEQRFVRNPFSNDPAALIYRTGDLGQWQSSGVLEYLGRNDDQVKIRGFRVELGEVEAQLLRQPLVREAAVISREDEPGDRRLVAYITARDSGAPNFDELRVGLKAVLPDHMIPSAFVLLKALPLNPNGKLDKRALPAPEYDSLDRREFEPPRGEVEQVIAKIWQDLLRVPRVGRRDNFFELGGHSLHLMRLNTRIFERFQARMSVSSVFRHPTLKAMARLVESKLNTSHNVDQQSGYEEGEI